MGWKELRVVGCPLACTSLTVRATTPHVSSVAETGMRPLPSSSSP